MKTMTGFANIFEKDRTYMQFREDFDTNPCDKKLIRDSKEAFKCRFASDYQSLLNKVSFSPRITEIPDFIFESLEKGKYSNATKTIRCIKFYCDNNEVWNTYCSISRKLPEGLKGNANHKFGKYYKKIYSDAKRELNHYKRRFNIDQINDYRFALLFFNIVTRTFYFSALPLHIYPSIYQECVEIDEKFANYYKYDSAKNNYVRIKFQKRGVRYFGEKVAWLLVYNNIIRYGLNK